jgi:hypothetical protein
MPAGTPTPEHLVAAFRASYLYSGNASASAREVGIEERTGRDLALTLVDDSSFAADRRKLRASALEELVAKRMRVVDKALERFEGELPMPAPAADGMAAPVVIDKRADYGKLVLEAEKNAHALAKLDFDRDPDNNQSEPLEVVVTLSDKGDAKKPDGSG